MAGDATLWGSLGAAAVALAWVLVRRVRRARRIMPRARMRIELSLQTPSTEPPEQRRRRHEPLSLEPPPHEHMPIELDPTEYVEVPSLPPAPKRFTRPRPDDEPPFSDRPTPPTRRNKRPPR